ncbi:BTB/POZ domain-containing protein At5g17580 [Fagus crenata]
MVNKQSTSASSWMSKSTSSEGVQLPIHGVPCTLDKELLAAKSAKIAAFLKENSQEDLYHFLRDIPADPKTFELVARFCHGFELQISAENVVSITCLAYYLGMTESHSKNNLLSKAITFFEQRILPSWNETIKALHTTENILQQAVHIGLVDASLKSIIEKALVDPCLLGEPMKNLTCVDESEGNDDVYRPNARRKLFGFECKSEDLSMLPLQLYEPIILAMNKHRIPSKYVATSLCTYAKKWVLSISKGWEKMPSCEKNSHREVIEAVERLLPDEKGLLPCSLLFDMLRSAIVLEANANCRNGFEIRIGKQLDEATVKDLLIPSQGYAKEVEYDIECVRRILKIFYGNYTCSDVSGLITVAALIEEFLAEVANDMDLKPDTFVSLAEISIAASLGTQRGSDGIYRAIDIYLYKHIYLTDLEREEVCRVLDCQKMSSEACEHAAKNEKLPLRVVVQVLFMGQLKLRDTITKEMQASYENLRREEVEEDLEKLNCGEEQVKTEMENMSNKVMDLERECNMIRKEIGSGCNHSVKQGKVSMWGEMKRKFGCITSMHDSNCQIKKKKVHPKY